jgi:hypothetical protein
MVSYKLIIAIIFILILNACEDVPIEVLPVPPPIDNSSFYPLVKGNTWTYIDSLFKRDSISVQKYTVRVVDIRVSQGRIWWKLESDYGTWKDTTTKYSISGDTVYSLQPHWDTEVVSLEFIKPQGEDTLRYTILLGGDIVLYRYAFSLNEPIKVPAGAFDGTIAFQNYYGFGQITQIIKPGLGLIRVRTDYRSDVHRIVVLEKYNLVL